MIKISEKGYQGNQKDKVSAKGEVQIEKSGGRFNVKVENVQKNDAVPK